MSIRRVGGRTVVGDWDAADPRRAFVEGAAWWQFVTNGATMWSTERAMAEAEAERRFARGDWPLDEDSELGHLRACVAELEALVERLWEGKE